MRCCESKIKSRITVLSKNNKYSTIVWQKLAKSNDVPQRNSHLEKNIYLNNLKVCLCTVDSTDLDIWEKNVKYSEGVILIIEAYEINSPEVQNFISDLNKQIILVLCNTTNIGDTNIDDSPDSQTKYLVCDIESWKGPDQGLSWLTESIK
ncbi:hypothetical protein M153_30908000475 [Pseudoloma neurophilia]|uniref:Uncharacterized protein n=1 Tax=Pseudoloma neurophilia TaxID=146866 RepID=A0A0R0LW98_9MICR|nr:hypothetical protein M153_30908000475 [Pseudoloma neurophilia]